MHSFGTFGALPRGTLSGLFSDSSGVSGPEGAGDPVGRGPSQPVFPLRIPVETHFPDASRQAERMPFHAHTLVDVLDISI